MSHETWAYVREREREHISPFPPPFFLRPFRRICCTTTTGSNLGRKGGRGKKVSKGKKLLVSPLPRNHLFAIKRTILSGFSCCSSWEGGGEFYLCCAEKKKFRFPNAGNGNGAFLEGRGRNFSVYCYAARTHNSAVAMAPQKGKRRRKKEKS